jgi:hypothetical protein
MNSKLDQYGKQTMEIIKSLQETQHQTNLYFQLSSSELFKSYGENKWTVKEILVHLSDAESVLLERIKRAISEPNQIVQAFDPDLWCEKMDYKNFPLEISKNQYNASRNSIIYLAEHFYIALGANEFTHSQMGKRTLKDEFDKVALHNQGHLAQIKKALS